MICFRCDMGYSGQKCEYATVTIPSYLSEMFQTSSLTEIPNVVTVSMNNKTYYINLWLSICTENRNFKTCFKMFY